MSPAFDDFRKPEGEPRTHGGRLLAYGSFATLFALGAILIWTGIWDVTDSARGALAAVGSPFGVALFGYLFIRELRSAKKH